MDTALVAFFTVLVAVYNNERTFLEFSTGFTEFNRAFYIRTWRNLSSSYPDLNCLLVCLAGLKLPVLFKVYVLGVAREPV